MDISGDESLFCNRGKSWQDRLLRGESDDSGSMRGREIGMKGEFYRHSGDA